MTEVLLQRLTVNCEAWDDNAALSSFKERSAKQNYSANSRDDATQRYDTRAVAASRNGLGLSAGQFMWFIERRARKPGSSALLTMKLNA